jgi:4-amino-4-deoxy-L-arabinose transferase-like glycosyltransferase
VLKVAQSAIGALGVWIVALLAARAAGPWAGAAAAALAAVYPPLIWICAYALSEAFYSVVALSSALLLWIATDTPPASTTARQSRLSWGFAAGIAAGAATLTRPATLIFIALALPWLLLRRHPRTATAMLAGVVIAIGPWTARNVREHGRFVLVSSQGGVTFWTGNNPLATGEGDMAANPAIKRRNLEIRTKHAHLTPEELEPVYRNEAWAFIREHPSQWLWLLVRKLFYTFVPIGPSYTLHSTLYYATSLIAYGVLVPLAVAGFIDLRRSGSQPWPLWLLAASAVLVCLVFFPQERFRLPVIDPALVVSAGAWAGWKRWLVSTRP